MTLILLGGAVFGLGVHLMIRAAIPSREPLAISLARLTVSEPTVVKPRLPRFFEVAGSLAVEMPWVRRDLAVVGRDPAVHAAAKMAIAVATGIGVLLTGALLTYTGLLGVPAGAVSLSIACAAAAYFLPDLELRDRAGRRRTEFRHALGSFLDVAAICFASGSGPSSGLLEAAQAGSGWAHERLRHALAGSQNVNDPPWIGLGRLGRELAIPELESLGASMTLAGEEGAQVRESIVAMSETLRGHLLADAEARASTSVERMSFPVAFLALSFIAFLIYPGVPRPGPRACLAV